MKQHTEPYTSVPELREKIFETWYETEWGTQEAVAGGTPPLQPSKSIARLMNMISRRFSRPTNRTKPTATPLNGHSQSGFWGDLRKSRETK